MIESTSRPFRWYAYPRSAGELTTHAVAVAVVLWGMVVLGLQGEGVNGRLSHFPKGYDFVQFYVSGVLAGQGAFTALVDEPLFRQAQAPLLGAHATLYYPAVYPPQIGLFFAPIAKLPYVTAYYVWSAVSVGFVLFCVWRLARLSECTRTHVIPATAVVLAFAPFPYLVLNGQASALALLALTGVAAALRRNSKLLAGIALGMIGYKPSLFLPAVAVCVLAGEWTMAASAVLTAGAQLLLIAPIIGWANAQHAVLNFLVAARRADVLAVSPYLMFSWRTFWTPLVPPLAARVAYVVCAAATVVFAAWTWRVCSNPLRRAGLLSLAVVLASPHLYLYDMVILVPALMATADALMTTRDKRLYLIAAAAFVGPFTVPLTALSGFQLTTPLLLAWLVALGSHPCDPPEYPRVRLSGWRFNRTAVPDRG